jgi:ribosomal protein L11 methyltransferase
VKNERRWVEKYQKSFSPIVVGEFRVRASWNEPQGDCIDVVIEPETIFGTGRHETTASCLEALSKFDLVGKNVLDVGCGSGILAIAAAKKGAIVSLCDTDPKAVERAARNCEINGVKPAAIWVGSVDQTSASYDLVTANIVAAVLVALNDDLRRVLNDGGGMIVSGVLDRYEKRVRASFGDLETLFVTERGEWRTFAFKKIKEAR